MNGRVALLEMDYTIGIQHSYRENHNILQNLLILKAVQLAYMMEHSSPFIGYPAPTVNRHTTTAFADGCNALPEVCKLKPVLHLLS